MKNWHFHGGTVHLGACIVKGKDAYLFAVVSLKYEESGARFLYFQHFQVTFSNSVFYAMLQMMENVLPGHVSRREKVVGL